MLRFLPQNEPQYFDYVVRVTNKVEGKGYDFESIYAKDTKIAASLNGHMGVFCFPYPSCPIPKDDRITFSFCFTDADKDLSYCFVHSRVENDERAAFCVVSRFYHPSLFSEVAVSTAEAYKKGIKEAEEFVKNVLSLQLIRRPHDWIFTLKGGFEIQNFDHLSPENEIDKLYRFLFTKFSPNDILSLVIAILLDCRIIMLSNNIEQLGNAVFALLGLIHPLQWPGSFIPLLPTAIATALQAPFAYIIGVHSSMASDLLNEEVDRYFVINLEAHYASIVGMVDFPPEILDVINVYSDKIRDKITQFKPLFPKHSIQKKIRKFILSVISTAYDHCSYTTPSTLYNEFIIRRDSVGDDFASILSQTQFIDQFMRQVTEEVVEDVLKAFWPKEEYKPAATSMRRRRETRKPIQVPRSGMRDNKAKAVEIHSLTPATSLQLTIGLSKIGFEHDPLEKVSFSEIPPPVPPGSNQEKPEEKKSKHREHSKRHENETPEEREARKKRHEEKRARRQSETPEERSARHQMKKQERDAKKDKKKQSETPPIQE